MRPHSPLFPYTTLFRSRAREPPAHVPDRRREPPLREDQKGAERGGCESLPGDVPGRGEVGGEDRRHRPAEHQPDRKSTRLNSSHMSISYAVFCLKKKKN